MPTSATEFVTSGAEALLRVSAVRIESDHAELSVESGPWLRDPIAGFSRASLAVALDDVTGYVIAAGAPSGSWPVSLGIRVDFLADPSVDGPPMTVTGDLVARHDGGGATRGAVVNASGDVIALITQRSHLVTIAATPTNPVHAPHIPSRETTVREALGIREVSTGVVEMPPSRSAANGMGNVHGGILLCGIEFAAMSAMEAHGDQRTTSIDISYVRPGDASDTTTFRAELQHRGRSLAVVRVVAENTAGKAIVIATAVVQSGARR